MSELEQVIENQKEVIKALTLIRENYEKKFGVRIFANGNMEEIKDEA